MAFGNDGGSSSEMDTGQRGRGSNIILVGVMGSGKSTIGERLAYYVGFGFIDVDKQIERRERKSVADIFAQKGEDYFRNAEHQTISDLSKARNQVISVGGGAVMADDNWQILKGMGTVVWLNTPPTEIARRFVMKPDDIRSRPLLKDLVEIEDKSDRQKKLTDRLAALIAQRQSRYSEANVVLEISYSTAETSAQLLKAMLTREGLL